MKLPLARIAVSCSLAVLITCVGAPIFAQSDDDIVKSFKMDYRPISGKTWRDVVTSIRSNLIATSLTARYEGVTSYDVDITPSGNACTPDNTMLEFKLKISVPQLDRRSTLAGDDLACWANYNRTLTDHEEGHVMIAEHDGKALLADIRSMSGASCGDIKRLIGSRLKELQATQDAYDRISDHGLTQWRAWQLQRPANAKAQELSNRCTILASGDSDDIKFNN